MCKFRISIRLKQIIQMLFCCQKGEPNERKLMLESNTDTTTWSIVLISVLSSLAR